MGKGTNLASELSYDELLYLLELLKKENLKGNHLEIGTGSGGTLLNLIKCYNENTTPHFVVIDPMNYFPNQYCIVKKNLTNNGLDPNSVEFRRTRSYDAFKDAEKKGEKYDFIFIDGAHKLRYVMKDLSWARLLTVGGILCLHDYHIKTKGVILAANRFLRRYKNYTKVSVVNKLLVLRKNGESNIPEISKVDHIYANVISLLLQIEHSVYKRIKRLR